MAEITCTRTENTDHLILQGRLDDTTLEDLTQTISRLRQQGSRKMLLQGDNVRSIQTQNLEKLARPIRVYRSTGGVIALAGFSAAALDVLRRASWYRYLNIFRTREEAWQFLNPHAPPADPSPPPIEIPSSS